MSLLWFSAPDDLCTVGAALVSSHSWQLCTLNLVCRHCLDIRDVTETDLFQSGYRYICITRSYLTLCVRTGFGSLYLDVCHFPCAPSISIVVVAMLIFVS